ECMAHDAQKLVVVVGRLAALLKIDGLKVLIAAVGRLAKTYDVALAVIGEGPERPTVESAAAAANAQAGRQVVRLLGARKEPRPYYLAADIVVGMGGSALRAMALGKPLIVQGEKGFWEVADASTAKVFQRQGWYGVGTGENPVTR